MVNEHKEKLSVALQEWADANKVMINRKLSNGFAEIMLNACPVIGNYSTWLFAGSAATLALLIVNIHNISNQIEITNIKYSLLFLSFSLFSGIAAKYFNTSAELRMKTSELGRQLGKELKELSEAEMGEVSKMAEEHGIDVDIDISKEIFLEHVVIIFPKFLQSKAKKSILKSIDDPLNSAKEDARTFLLIYLSIGFQFIFIMLFIFSVFFGIKM